MTGLVRQWVPPALVDFYRRRRAPERRFFATDRKFEEIEFEDPWGTDRYLASARHEVEKLARKPFPNDPVPSCLTTLLVDLLSQQGPCRVLDFAGGAGIVYLRIRPHLAHASNVSWDVVDNPRLAEIGVEASAGDGRLRFLAALPEPGTPYDLVYVNTSLQYLSDWRSAVDALAGYGAGYLLFTQTLVTEEPTFLVLQAVQGSRVPCTFIHLPDLVAFLDRRGYDLASRCPVGYGDFSSWWDESVPERQREKHCWHLVFSRRR